MRIRKNAKLCHLLLSNGASVPLEAFQSHVCQLNQSPWDVIPFASDSPQFEGEDSFTGNDSPADSIGAVESVASMMDTEDKSLPKIEDMVVDDGNDIGQKEAKLEDDNGGREQENGIVSDKGEEKPSYCQKTDGKGWQCKNEAKDGQSFCEHHLSLLRSYNSGSYNTPSKKAAAAAAAAAGARRARARAAKKATSSNPYEFYYYSGFGPLWGKRRGDRNGEGTKNEPKILENSTITETTATAATNVSPTATATASATTHSSTPSSSSQIDHEEFDYVDDDEEDDTNGDSGKKRMRKPVKARSLKSLM